MSCKRTRLVPGNVPDRRIQKEFIATINDTIEQAGNNNDIVLFLDPTHQVYNVENGYAWQEVGAEHTKIVNSNSGRRRINIIGALNAASLKPTTIVTEANCDRETMVVFLNEIKKEYEKAENIHVFLDNAKYNHSKKVKKEAEKLGIKLIFLPPYCPNLNLIERLWKFLKKKVRKNKYYDTFEKFEKAICDFFKNIDQYAKELKKLLALNFEIINPI